VPEGNTFGSENNSVEMVRPTIAYDYEEYLQLLRWDVLVAPGKKLCRASAARFACDTVKKGQL